MWFGRKIQTVLKLWEIFVNVSLKIQEKIVFLTIFGKVVATNGASEIT